MNKFKKIAVLLIFLLAVPVILRAQYSDEARLASQYYQEGEYEKASVYYEELFEKTGEMTYYTFLLECYINMEEYRQARKLVKKQLRENEKPEFHVDMGYVYKAEGEDDDAGKAFRQAIRMMGSSPRKINDLANKFRAREEPEYAIKVLKKGQKTHKGKYPFNFELAQLYGQQGAYEKMMDEYLDLLEVNTAYIQSVQNAMQTFLNPDPENEKTDMLKSKLLSRIQKSSSDPIFSEMLIWLYIQEKNFSGAYIQAKALDKRNKEDGKRLMALARLAVSNRGYEVAEKCYEYVIEKGKDNYYYLNAKMELVSVLNKKITTSPDYSREDLLTLERTYESTLQELGKNASTVPLMLGLSNLQAFYLDKTKEAVSLLNKTTSLPRIEAHDKALAKIKLADIQVMTGDVWEASLLYSQVEKDFKHDELGERAKFKNAKISYYTGDFKWAKAQLDVLKASTSKLISNDAMQLSLIITDNTTMDTIAEPLEMFARADLLLAQHKPDRALALLDSLKFAYPGHSLGDEILYKKGEIMLGKRNYEKAADYFREVTTTYTTDILADDALFNLAEITETKLGDEEKAMDLYKELMTAYPGSLYVVEARKRYRMLRGSRTIHFQDDGKEIKINDIE